MTFRQLTAFAAVAKHMNITKAAQELRTSQPSLSKHLKGLEDDYKVKLFTRKGKGIQLTEDGSEFLRHIESILAQLQKIEERFLKSSKKKESTTLIVGGTYEVSASILPSLLALFKKRYPNIQVVLRSNTISILEQMMLKGDPEIAVASIAPRSPEFTAESCVPLRLVPFAATGYRIPKEKELCLADLGTVPLIVRDNRDTRGTTETLLLRLRELGYRPNVVMRCESPEAIKMAVSKKLGVGILYKDLLKQDIARGLFKQLHIRGLSMEGNTYAIYHKHRPLSSCGEAFLKLLRRWCEEKRSKKEKIKALNRTQRKEKSAEGVRRI
jgi:DNA-binding transcriptional LysR family regulator